MKQFLCCVLLAACSPTILLCGCGRKEPATGAAGVESPVPEKDLTVITDNIPRRPHPPASALLWSDDLLDSFDVAERKRMLEEADQFLDARLPDFAIKDMQRPWLDRQYVPREWRVLQTDQGVRATLKVQILRWDEGRAVDPGEIDLELSWDGNDWVLEKAPEDYFSDLRNAMRTLRSGWQPGERELPDESK